jgi:hypothetical protein
MAKVEVTAEMLAAARLWVSGTSLGDDIISREDILEGIYRAMEEARRKEAFARELRRHGMGIANG